MQPLRIVHEDERLLAVDKPAGQEVIPGRGARPAGSRPLSVEVSERLGSKAFVVHRLDREASGLVLFAKDASAHKALCLQFEKREVRKTYLALVQGSARSGRTVDQPIRAFGSGRMGIGPGGKPSVTQYRVLRLFDGATLLEVRPLTGRRHQIRVHLYSAGHPVLGDARYGDKRPVGGAPRLMLHALELALRGPDSKPLVLRCEPPEDFQAVIEGYAARPQR